MINPNFVSRDDFVKFAAGAHNRGVQPSVTIAKLNDLFSRVRKNIRLVHEDNRRSIREYIGDDFSINEFLVHSSHIPLGNHYHKNAAGGNVLLEGAPAPGVSEIFFFDEGGGELLLQNVAPDGSRALSAVEQFRVMVNDLYVFSPFQAHTFLLRPGTKFRGFRTIPFNENDKDLNPWNLELPL